MSKRKADTSEISRFLPTPRESEDAMRIFQTSFESAEQHMSYAEAFKHAVISVWTSGRMYQDAVNSKKKSP